MGSEGRGLHSDLIVPAPLRFDFVECVYQKIEWLCQMISWPKFCPAWQGLNRTPTHFYPKLGQKNGIFSEAFG